MAKLPRAGDLQKVDKYLGDITQKLDKISQLGDVFAVASQGANADIANVRKLSDDWGSALEAITKGATNAKSALDVVSRVSLTRLAKVMDKVGKGIIAMGLDQLKVGFSDVATGIEKVYDLHERWTKLLGQFNTKMGATGSTLKASTKQAMVWESTVRGLTDEMGEGTRMFTEFSDAFGRAFDPKEMGKTLDQTQEFGKAIGDWNKLGVEAARGLGIGGAGAGKIQKAIYQLNESLDPTPAQFKEITKDAKKTYAQITAGANAAGVPVGDFASEIAENSDAMVSFGKDGKKTFIESASFARKLGVSLKGLLEFTKLTDTFDSTAQAAAKLNTVFGTSINSVDLMMEQDPSKRLEMVRQSLLDQGKTYDSLSRQEREFLGETMHLSQEELAGTLKTGQSLDQYQKKQAREQEKTQKNQKFLQDALQKTRTTLFAFGQAWDNVTKHIEGLLKPFTDALGLTKDFGKQSMSFGQIMSAAFKKLNNFIDMVAKNPAWIKFTQSVAQDLTSAFQKVGELSGDKRTQDFITHLVDGMHSFYDIVKKAFTMMINVGKMLITPLKMIFDHIQLILGAFAAFKLLAGGVSVVKGISSAARLLGSANFGGFGAGAKPPGGMAGFLAGGKMGGAGAPGTGGAAGGGLMGKVFGKAAGYMGATSKLSAGLGGLSTGMGAGKVVGIGEELVGALGGPKLEQSLAGTIGSAVGGAVGMIWGPLGAAAGGAIGKFVGDLGTKLYDKWSKSDATKKREEAEIQSAAAEKIRDEQKNDMSQRDNELSLEEIKLRDESILANKGSAAAFDKLAAIVRKTTDAMSDRAKIEAELSETKSKIGLSADQRNIDALQNQQGKKYSAEDIANNPALMAQYTSKFGSTQASTLGGAGSYTQDSNVKKFNADMAKDLSDKLEEAKTKQINDQKEFSDLQFADEKKLFAIKLQTTMMEATNSKSIKELRANLAAGKGADDFSQDDISTVLNNLPHAASGGITMGPTLAGERGPEAIIPLTPHILESIANMPSQLGMSSQDGGTARTLGGRGGKTQTPVEIHVQLHMDGNKVAKSIARTLIEQESN
ncbi:MAG: hypothetical protein ACYDHY_07795 [Acidiferrobacterales bacterium]